MGRRAKNKQGDPAPLRDPSDPKPSYKKPGKRKADDDAPPAKRPAKKVKEAAEPVPTLKKSRTTKPGKSTAAHALPAAKGSRSHGDSGTKSKKKVAVVEEDEDVLSAGGDSEGWEDVNDEDNLQAQAK